MTHEFAGLMAQVIPVVLLALVLELRAIINAPAEEVDESRRQPLAVSPKGYHYLGFATVYGLVMIALARSEMVVLSDLLAGPVPKIEATVAFFATSAGLGLAVVVPAGIEVFRRNKGLDWPFWVFVLYLAAGLLLGVAMVGSVLPYLHLVQ